MLKAAMSLKRYFEIWEGMETEIAEGELMKN